MFSFVEDIKANNATLSLMEVGRTKSRGVWSFDLPDRRASLIELDLEGLNDMQQEDVVRQLCTHPAVEGGKVSVYNPSPVAIALLKKQGFIMELPQLLYTTLGELHKNTTALAPELATITIEAGTPVDEAKAVANTVIFTDDNAVAAQQALPTLQTLGAFSGFSESHVANAIDKGLGGFRVALANSQPFLHLMSTASNIQDCPPAAFCRTVPLGQHGLYLCDTFVSKKYFDSKDEPTSLVTGTKGIYHAATTSLLSKYKYPETTSIYVLHPPGREAEFLNLGFKHLSKETEAKDTVVMTRFGKMPSATFNSYYWHQTRQVIEQDPSLLVECKEEYESLGRRLTNFRASQITTSYAANSGGARTVSAPAKAIPASESTSTTPGSAVEGGTTHLDPTVEFSRR